MHNNKLKQGGYTMKRSIGSREMSRGSIRSKSIGSIRSKSIISIGSRSVVSTVGSRPLEDYKNYFKTGVGEHPSLRVYATGDIHPLNVYAHKRDTNTVLDTFFTGQIIKNNVKINDSDGIKTNLNKREAQVERILLRKQEREVCRRKTSRRKTCKEEKYKDVCSKEEKYKDVCSKEEKYKDVCSKEDTSINFTTRINFNTSINNSNNTFYNLSRLNSKGFTLPLSPHLSSSNLRDETLYCIYKMYNMMDSLLYSSFLSKLTAFNFVNLIFGLKIFRRYLEFEAVDAVSLHLLYCVSCLIASKYLDDRHVFNYRLPEELRVVNKLEMKILTTLKYSLDLDLETVYDIINELFLKDR